MANIATVHDKICDILDTVSAGVLAATYRYPPSKLDEFPAAVVLFGGDSERMIDTVTNEQSMVFSINTIFPTDESEDGYNKWLRLLDALKAELRKDDHQTLSGNAVYFLVDTTGRPEYSMDFAQPVVILGIRVTVRVLQSITA